MHLLFLAARDWTHPLRAGGDLYMSALAREAARAGHQVTYVSSSYPGCRSDEWLNGIHVIRLGGPVPQMLRALRYYRGNVRDRVDAVVAEVIGGMYLPYFAPLWIRKPLVCFWYQYSAPLAREQFRPPFHLPAVLMEHVLRLAHRGVQKVTLTPDRFKDLVAFGVEPRELNIIPGALTEEQIALVPVRHCRTNPPTFIFLGKVRRYKCPMHLIEAVAILRSRGITARAILAGYPDGRRYEAEVLRRISDLELNDCVEVRIDISEREKFALLAGATAVVVPSPVEGFSLCAIEGNIAGTPAVVSDGVPNDVVADLDNGLRYRFGDIHALADCLQRLVEDSDLTNELGFRGRIKAQTYTWTANLERLIDLIRPQLRNSSAGCRH